ncbi:rab proteins geranylgeranyltransferase component A 2-like isoform X2 [Tubulanus polymorphus]|uniref:rab proteins geranylgeranyltransferase component A 2-like isoform X2 n=1 Tax=Tubulanus polymorphus TaxID=672921 RepID=UPI003DA23DDF
MDEELPTEYDVIILGTVAESIVAAAFARIGQRVLHLDRNDHYGGDWSTFNFDGIQRWIESHQEVTVEAAASAGIDDSSLIQEGETLIPLIQNSQTITNLLQNWFIRHEDKEYDNSEPLVPSNTPVSQCSFQLDIQLKDDNEADSEATEEGSSTTPVVADSASEEVAGCSEEVAGCSEEVAGCSEEVAVCSEEVAGCSGESKAKEVMPCNVQIEEKINQHLKKEWTVEELKRQWRKFNIDLSPKLLFCRGPLVELLISSDVAKYCEFKTVSRILTRMNDKLEQVPCSRADVFSSKAVSMIEKRMLMKFLTFCMDYDQHPEDYAGFEDRPFKDFLISRKLTPNIQHYVLQAIAMATEHTPTADGLAAVKKFLVSLGRYGNTAFLWTLYGSGELPQAFCRMCAVFGGIYCLRKTISNVIIDSENKCIGAISDGVRFKCKWLVAEASYASSSLLPQINNDRKISRAFFLTKRSIKEGTKDEVTFLRIPHSSLPEPVTVIELSASTYSVPEGLYLVHVFCRGVNEAREDLQFIEEILFPSESTTTSSSAASEDGEFDAGSPILWSVYFNQADHSDIDLESGRPDNVVLCSGPDNQLDFDCAVQQARCIFSRICPDEEFLPRAPNPEDIIYDDGANTTPQDPGFGPRQDENSQAADNTETSPSASGGNGPRPNTTSEETASAPVGAVDGVAADHGTHPDTTPELEQETSTEATSAEGTSTQHLTNIEPVEQSLDNKNTVE